MTHLISFKLKCPGSTTGFCVGLLLLNKYGSYEKTHLITIFKVQVHEKPMQTTQKLIQ
jgi:hypothetical protein